MTTARGGFTLVELSIVIVIIGLLIGGILVGQSLIESARINSQIKQIEQYDIAIANFKSKFRCLPADCNKFSYKIDSAGNARIGNGNNILDGHTTLTNFLDETIYFFSALSSAKMITEDYTNCGVNASCNGAGPWLGLIGKNAIWPELKIVTDKKGMVIVGDNKGGAHYFLGINFSDQPRIHTISNAAIIPVGLSAALDKKMDDGLPSAGNVYASTNRATVNSSCGVNGSLCAAYTDQTVMQIDVANGATDCTRTGTPRTYNVASTNLCRLTVVSGAN